LFKGALLMAPVKMVKNWRRMPPPTRMSDRIARIGPEMSG
jgi:hypothetical protein